MLAPAPDIEHVFSEKFPQSGGYLDQTARTFTVFPGRLDQLAGTFNIGTGMLEYLCDAFREGADSRRLGSGSHGGGLKRRFMPLLSQCLCGSQRGRGEKWHRRPFPSHFVSLPLGSQAQAGTVAAGAGGDFTTIISNTAGCPLPDTGVAEANTSALSESSSSSLSAGNSATYKSAFPA